MRELLMRIFGATITVRSAAMSLCRATMVLGRAGMDSCSEVVGALRTPATLPGKEVSISNPCPGALVAQTPYALREPWSKTSLNVWCRATLLSTFIVATPALGQYNVGFSWSRVNDWVVRPTSDAGTSTGNPANDSTGRPCWQYEWVFDGPGSPLGSPTPWYKLTATRMIWDISMIANPKWARGTDITPAIDSVQMVHTYGLGSFPYLPVVRWIYPSTSRCPVRLQVQGNANIVWSGGSHPTSTSNVDVAIVLRRADATWETLFSGTYSRPTTGTTLTLPVNVTAAAVLPGDAILFTQRSRTATTGWTYLDDRQLSINLVQSPSLVRTPPQPAITCPTGTAPFSVVTAGDGPFTYQWQIQTSPPPSETWLTLTTDPVPLPCGATSYATATPADASTVSIFVRSTCPAPPGTPSRWPIRCIVSNTCGSVTSNTAALTVCPADFDCSGALNVQDIFSFLNAWFTGLETADFDGFNGPDVADIFAFLNAWFAGC